MEQWEFRLDAKRRWYWRRTSDTGLHNVSSQTFETRAACANDAVKHGYTADAEENGEAREK